GSGTLGSSLGEASRPAEEAGKRKDSLEQLICFEEEEEEAGTLSPQQSDCSELDEVLLETEQGDDFASSVLAEPSSATPDSGSKTLSSGESSEDETEAAEKEGEAASILPSSVLDKAGAIAQHVTGSIRRSSLAQDGGRSLSYASPRLPSRSSTLSLSAEPTDRSLRYNSICSDPAETFGTTDLTLLSPHNDSLFEADQGIRQRRDSTLSKQDRLLIGKIKNYYENAGNQNPTFGLQRRESLTYIPTGLVRSSVSRFNSFPKNDTDQTNPSTTSFGLDPSSVESLRSRSQSLQDNLSEDEEFRPSFEMIKIWQAMEEASRKSRVTSVNRTKTLSNSCDRESGVSDLSTITEESTSPLPLTPKAPGMTRTGSLKHTLKVFEEEAIILKAPVPRVTQLKAEAEEERPNEDSHQLDNVDKMSKVLLLARQYSQRIKMTKPVVGQRSQGILISKKTLPCVVEEKEDSGTVTSSLPVGSCLYQTQSPTPGLTCSLPVSPGQAHSRSPLGAPPPIDCFSWPDVRKLRSKYSNTSRPEKSPVGQSQSPPEHMSYRGLRRHSKERSKRLHRANSLDPQLSGAQATELQKLQDRGATYDGYYITAQASLPNDPEHQIIVMEKLPEPEEKISIMAVIDRCRAYQESDEYKLREEAKAKTESARPQEPDKTAANSVDQDDKSQKRSSMEVNQQSIVKNLREKFQSLS
uniref:Uncharacterized protein n=1 Tax=Monopterus albus TaxID=43700 RepID=A0A3Q3JRG3_MONAL